MGKFGISVTEIATLILPVSHSLPSQKRTNEREVESIEINFP